MKLVGVILLSFTFFGCYSDSRNQEIGFHKIILDLSNSEDSINFSKWKSKNGIIKDYEDDLCQKLLRIGSESIGVCYLNDEDYIVLGNCSGEFGGFLIFIEREFTDFGYYLESTCPLMVQEIDESYFVTESLAHLSGYGSVKKIDDPKNLEKVKLDSLWYFQEQLKNSEIRKKGYEFLIDTIGLTIGMFFKYENGYFVIYSDQENTYLGLIKDGRIHLRDTVLDFASWTYLGDEPGGEISGIYHHPFKRSFFEKNSAIQGNIYVKEDTIIVGYKYQERTSE